MDLHDVINTGSTQHIDFMQGFVTRFFYHDILIDSNVIIEQEDINLPFVGSLPCNINVGIDLTDEDWTGHVITNNFIAVSNHSVSIDSCHDCLYAGNTMVLGSVFVLPTTHQGFHSTNLVIINNTMSLMNITDPAAIVDHNIIFSDYLGVPGVVNQLSGVANFNAPGTYGNANIQDTGGRLSELTAFDVPTVTHNFNLLSSAPARGAGVNTTPSPYVDINGLLRAQTHDVGAHVFQ
jgi:hypothetical protein